jgi:class 3 adenylate cyclase
MNAVAASFETSQNDELVVSNRNVNLLVTHAVRKGIVRSEFLRGLGYRESYFDNPDHWVSLPVFVELMRRLRVACDDDPTSISDAGLEATRSGRLGTLEALKRALGVAFLHPGHLMKRLPEYNAYFNRTKSFELVELSHDHALFVAKFRSTIDAVYDFNSGPLVKGVIASIPTIWDLPPARVDELVLPYDVVRLLREQFSMFAEIQDGVLFVDGRPHGRVIELLTTETKLGPRFLGRHRDIEDRTAPRGIIITRSLDYRNYPLLVVDQVYGAPAFALRVQWSRISRLRQLSRVIPLMKFNAESVIHELEARASQLQRYARELEETIRERSTLLIQEKREVERLKEELGAILSSQLPADLVSMMTTARIEPRERNGIVLFADLVAFSKRVHDADDFAPMLRDLRRYFELANSVIKSRGGWVYKYLGDGIMAVFGGYHDEEDHETLAAAAIDAGQRLVKLVNDMGWDLRVGIEYGSFIAGEVGPAEERLWDFLGETINLACRLCQHGDENTVVLGPQIRALLGEQLRVDKKVFDLKGIGTQTGFVIENDADTYHVHA